MTPERARTSPKGGSLETGIVSEDLLKRYGATLVPAEAGAAIFEQGDRATHFFVVRTGRIRMVSTSEKGREFTQGWFDPGQSFGEPPFFDEVDYPAAALAEVDSTVWKCARESFLKLLREHPEVHLKLTRALSRRLVYKALMLGEIAIEEAEHRLATLFRYLRELKPTESAEYRIPFTRQQLADMTGLRVETVIRTVKIMESKRVLRIVGGRIVWNAVAAEDHYGS
jgi:CRP-like cAMP-binding protein